MDNVEQYAHWYFMGIVARDIPGWFRDQSINWATSLEYKLQLDAKIEFYDKLLNKVNNKK